MTIVAAAASTIAVASLGAADASAAANSVGDTDSPLSATADAAECLTI